MPLLPRIPLPGVLNDIINGLLGAGESALNAAGQLAESIYSGIRSWLWRPLKRAINSTIDGLDDVVDALSGLPDDLLALTSKLDNLILEGVGLTAEIFKTAVIDTALDWLEDLAQIIIDYIDEHWEDS